MSENIKTYTLIYTLKFASGNATYKEFGISAAMLKNGMITVWYPEGSLESVNFPYYGEMIDFRLVPEY
jgi:hypothetical protein